MFNTLMHWVMLPGYILAFAVIVDHVRQMQRYVLLSLQNRMRHTSTVLRQLHSLMGAI